MFLEKQRILQSSLAIELAITSLILPKSRLVRFELIFILIALFSIHIIGLMGHIGMWPQCYLTLKILCIITCSSRRRNFPFRKQAMPLLTVDAFPDNSRCHL